ncbi:MAG: extracellular solute-binding protein [Chloroflexia bacterium]|nr:extracellular solute-binding protein [Chloroflexia bacterium]
MPRSRQHQAGFTSRPFSRRSAIRGAGMAGMAATIGAHASSTRAATLVQSTPTVDISGTTLSILQWQHFVPVFDEWLDTFVAEWEAATGVTVQLDRINTADIPATFAAEIAAEQGHDIIEHIASLPQYEESVMDMTDLVAEATARHGAQLDMCMRNSYNPTTEKFYGFTHGFAPDPANYRQSLWTEVGLDTGPSTFDELLSGGTEIWNNQGVQMGIGMSQEIDSNMAAQAMIWAFGGAVQDENENITINSPETLAAVEYMKSLFESCMTPEVFGWNAASNNQLLVAGQASYILNSISAYRTAQDQQPETANDIFLGVPLVGPGGDERALAHGHAVFTSMIPTYAANPDAAMEFLLHLTANYQAAVDESLFYNFPAFPETYPDLTTDGGPLDNDPYGSDPADKLAILKTANDWTVNLGWPGPANAMIGEAFNTFVLSDMMAQAARGDLTPQDALAEAETRLNEIAQNWRDQGLMGGG